MKNTILKLLIVLSPFTAWFALSGKLRVNIILLLLLFVVSSLDVLNNLVRTFPAYKRFKEDIWVFLFLFSVLFSFLFAEEPGKALNHLIALNFTFLVAFLFLRHSISTHFEDPFEVFKLVTISVIIICTVSLIEFTLKNFIGLDIRPFFILAGDDSLIPEKLGGVKRLGLFESACGPADEPGSTSLFLNAFGPLALFYAHHTQRKKWFKILLWLYPVTNLLLTSTAGIVIMVFSYFIYSLADFKGVADLIKRSIIVFLIITIGLTVFFPDQSRRIIDKTVVAFEVLIVAKVTLDSRDGSAKHRTQVWMKGFKDFGESPFFGKGPGYGSAAYKTGYVSMYLTYLAELGVFGFSFWALFVGSLFYKTMKLPLYPRRWLLMPLSAVTIHLLIVGDYYHFHHWIVYSSIQLFHSNFLTLQDPAEAAV